MIVIDTEPLPPQFHWQPSDIRSGTVEFYVKTAENLYGRDDDIRVIYDGPETRFHRVSYLPRDKSFASNSSKDLLIVCNQKKKPHPLLKSVFWTNKHGWTEKDVPPGYDDVVVISEYQRSIFGSSARVVGHGTDLQRDPTVPKEKFCLFSSSHDRGLDFLRGIWPEVKEKTGYDLVFTGGLPEKEVDSLYQRAAFWLHPGLGVELFCISALKAQAAGCCPIAVPHMALEETVKYGYVSPDLWMYKDTVIKALTAGPLIVPEMKIPTWAEVTDQLVENY